MSAMPGLITATPGLTRMEYIDGYEIGVGVSSFRGQARGNAVLWEGDPTLPTAGFTTDVSISLATSQEDFFRSLGVSAEVSASYGLGSVSAKTSYAESFKSTKLSSWIVVRVAVTQVYRQLGPRNNPVFTADALAMLASDGGALQFFQTYGDLYVSGVESGAEFVGVLQIDSASEEAKQELKVSWDASYSGGLSAATKGEVDNVLSTSKSTSSKMFTCHVVGGTPDAVPKELSIDDMAACCLAFPSKVDKNTAVPFTVYLQDYRALYRPPGTHLSSPELDNAKALLAAINADLQTIKSAGDTVQAILNHPERYMATLKDLTAQYQPASKAIQCAIKTFTGIADGCVASFTSSDTPRVPDVPPAPTFSIDLPPLNPDPAFTILSALGSPPLVIANDGQQPAPHLVLRHYDDADTSQRWIRKAMGDDRFQLIAGDTKVPLSGTVDASQPLLHLVGNDPTDTAGSWAAAPVGGGDACAIGDATGKVLEVRDGSTQVGTPICLAAKNDAAMQQWSFLPVGTSPSAARPAGMSLSSPHDMGTEASTPPAIVAFNGLFHAFFRDPTGTAIYHVTSPDGAQWAGANSYKVGPDTSASPCPVVFGEQLHIFYRDVTGNGIYHVASSDGSSFAVVGPGDLTRGGYFGLDSDGQVSAAVLGDTLCLAAKAGNRATAVVGKPIQ